VRAFFVMGVGVGRDGTPSLSSHLVMRTATRRAPTNDEVLMTLTPLLAAVLLAIPGSAAPASSSAEPARATATATATATDAGLPGLPRLRLPWRGKAKAKAGPTAKAPKVDREPMAVTDRRLRLLVSQQEAFYADSNRYGRDVSRLARGRATADTTLDAVQVQVLYASRRGWTAIATHPGAPGRSCVVFVGHRERLPLIPRTRADAHEAVDEGRPACDR
jgi:hypothetical protein